IRVAVAEGGERIAQAQARQRRRHVGEYLDGVACRQEHLEGFCGDTLVVAVLASVRRERGDAQVAYIVCVMGLAARELLAGGAHLIARQREARAMLLQPGGETLLGTLQHRFDIPECIIEVESDGAYVAQHPRKVTTAWRHSLSSSATRTTRHGRCDH